jgi:hypothetical protein
MASRAAVEEDAPRLEVLGSSGDDSSHVCVSTSKIETPNGRPLATISLPHRSARRLYRQMKSTPRTPNADMIAAK